MDFEKLTQWLHEKPKVKQYSGLVASTANIEKIRQSAAHKPETQNIHETFLGLAVKESQFMPDNIAVFTDSKDRVAAIIKLEGDRVTVTEVDITDMWEFATLRSK